MCYINSRQETDTAITMNETTLELFDMNKNMLNDEGKALKKDILDGSDKPEKIETKWKHFPVEKSVDCNVHKTLNSYMVESHNKKQKIKQQPIDMTMTRHAMKI